MVLSKPGAATAAHSAWNETGTLRDHVLADGEPHPAAGVLKAGHNNPHTHGAAQHGNTGT